ncbi:MAG: hypothetical protein IPL61_34660 [Myxococcales bacterium]|nr:hypothetical protein [Myxococcales bacterium]
MTYRDDHEAALARADGLEVEVEQLERERAELAAERDRLAAERDELRAREAARPAKPTKATRTAKAKAAKAAKAAARAQGRAADGAPRPDRAVPAWVVFAFVGVVVVAMALLFGRAAMQGRARVRAHDRWKAAGAAQQHHKRRWRALLTVEPCVDIVAFDAAMIAQRSPEHYDPRTDRDPGYGYERLAGNCTGGAQELAADPTTAPAVRAGLTRWLTAEAVLAPLGQTLRAYSSNRDWVEDDLAGARAQWATIHTHLAGRRRIFADLRATVLPALRAEMRALQTAHAKRHGQDETWWRIELGLALWDIADRAAEVTGVHAGRAPDDAAAPPVLQAPVAQLVAAARSAPVELRRELRTIDWITGPLAEGQLPGGETPLWHLARAARDVLGPTVDAPPALPPDPGAEPPIGD